MTDNITNYKNLEFKLFDCASQIRDIYADKGLSAEYGSELDGILDRIRTRRFRVAVMGEFKRGKSTFINALLGARVLPADVTPTTATQNRITYGDAPRVTIRGKDGSEYEIGLGEIADYVTKLTGEGERRAARIEEAVVAYPAVICQNHVDILDTPGLNDDEAMTALSLGAASAVDAVILVLSALSPFSDLEAGFAAKLITLDNIQNIFFVVSFIDQIEEGEREGFLANLKSRVDARIKSELTSARAGPEVQLKARRILGGMDMKLLAVSSTDALGGIISGDNKKLKSSGLEALKGELFQFLTSTQGASLVQKSRAAILRHCENLQRINRGESASLRERSSRRADIPRRLAEYQANWEPLLTSRLAAVRSVAAEAAQKINREKNAAAKEMMSLLRAGSDAPLSMARLAAGTAARVNGELRASLLETARNAVASCLGEFGANERAAVGAACAESSELLDVPGGAPRGLAVFDGGFDALALAREPGFFWGADAARAITEASDAERPRHALTSLDGAFSAYVSAWESFINDLCAEITSYARAEAECLVPALAASGRETNAAVAARLALALKSMEKEDRRIGEILATMNGIPEHF